jgi:hypothetical protein
MSEKVWKVKEDYYGMNVESVAEEEEDELFRRKGWNKVDSGFRLWGGGDSLPVGPRPEASESRRRITTIFSLHRKVGTMLIPAFDCSSDWPSGYARSIIGVYQLLL